MPIQRIVQGEAKDEEGRPTGEVVLENIAIDHVVRSQAAREAALLAEAAKNREAAGYAGLSRSPTREPLTAQEAEMAEKTPEQIERESVNTSGQTFQRMQEQQEEKLKQENAVTAHAGVVKVADANNVRLIPTPENYSLEAGQRSEGVPTGETPPMALAQGGGVRRSAMDAAEVQLKTAEQGSETSAQHATGTSSAEPTLKQTDAGDAKAAEPRSEEEVRKMAEEGRKAANEQAQKDAQAQQKSGAKESGSEDLDSLTVEDLKARAEKQGVEVTRGDGKDGAPVKADYVKALSK